MQLEVAYLNLYPVRDYAISGKWPNLEQGPKFEQPAFNCNICSNFTHRASRLCLNHTQERCEWAHGVLWAEPGQKLHFKVGCSNFDLVGDFAVYTLLEWIDVGY